MENLSKSINVIQGHQLLGLKFSKRYHIGHYWNSSPNRNSYECFDLERLFSMGYISRIFIKYAKEPALKEE